MQQLVIRVLITILQDILFLLKMNYSHGLTGIPVLYLVFQFQFRQDDILFPVDLWITVEYV